MRRLKDLIHEIHRRSLWQVLGIYAVASWAVLQVVDTLGGALNLPGWFPSVALAFLIVGLPIVLATAFVQEGVSGRGERDAGEAGAPEDAPSGRASGLFTWRNAFGGGVLAFALLGFVGTGWILFGGGLSSNGALVSREQSVAVLPFVNMSGDPDNEYFSDGITEEILNALAQLPELRVRARTSSFAFKGRNIPIAAIADTLDVAYILEGSVRRDGNRVLITAQLVDARVDAHLWSQTYERDLDDVFAIQREIALAITDALQIELGESVPLLAQDVPTTSEAAHDLYLRGRFELNQRGAHVADAIRYFEEAIDLDPEYARAYGGLALAEVLSTAYGVATPGAVDRALEAADRAIELDSTLSEPHTARGYVSTRIGGVLAAERELRQAIRLDLNDANAHHFLGWALMARGMWDEAQESVTRAILLDPSNPAHRWRRANLHLFVGRWADGEADAREALRLSPDDPFARLMLTGSLVLSGQVEALRAVTGPDDELGQLWLTALEDPEQLDEAIPATLIGGWMAAWLDRREIALARFERSLEGATATSVGFGTLSTVRSAALTPLGQDPRFQAILRRLEIE